MIGQPRYKKPHRMNPIQYEMARRKEIWKSISDPLEKQLMIPPEEQPAVVAELVSQACYNNLASMLGLPSIVLSQEQCSSSVDTVIPFVPPDESFLVPETSRMTLDQESKVSSRSTKSESTSSRSESESVSFASNTETEPSSHTPETKITSDDYDYGSEFVEVEKKIPHDQELMLKHKAILKFLSLPEVEAATWRVKETKDVSELSEMTLEEQGDFLINKIAVDFCEWMKKLGGDEKSFISEEILKELFQIGMDNPASRAICIKMREKRVLYHKLAEFLQVPKKSYHEVLTKHLNWDAEVEKKPSRLVAFGEGLPKSLRFKTPKTNTAETWLEWNQLTDDQLSFADVYSTIKDLRSTKEYCKWLILHPEHKKPKYLVEQGMFEQRAIGRESLRRSSDLKDESRLTAISTTSTHVLTANLDELLDTKIDMNKFRVLIDQTAEVNSFSF